ncbi:phage tail protein [Sphingomonas hankookensis]|uniref:phage tail protein n=1 Tax=Sphingomonas hankookensis TaxID=563996 RepID=UPI003D3033F3
MAEDFVIAIEGLAATRSLESLPKNMLLAAQRAVNRTADRASTASRRGVREQINFGAQYLTGTDSTGKQRLGVSKRANAGSLEAIITGRQRPTSLARFVTGNPQPGKAGVNVSVAPGFARFMRRAFLLRLPAGRTDLETKSNLGLAIRLKPNEVIHNKRVMLRLRGNLYLLYGPSVDQVFASVREDVAPDAEQFLGGEFVRLMGLDL